LLENATGVDQETRASLLKTVNARLEAVQTEIARLNGDGQAEEPPAQAEPRDTVRRPPPRDVERQPPTKRRDDINDLFKDRRAALEMRAEIRKRQEAGRLATQREIEIAAIPETEDYRLPKNWNEITERRKKLFAPKLTKAEENLKRALDSTMSVNFNKTSFLDVLNYLQDKTHTAIFADREMLREANVEYEDPVDLKAEKVTYRTILRKVLRDRGLTYIVRNGIVEVMTPQKAREMMVTRVYSVAGLITGPTLLEAQIQLNQIIDSIMLAEPSSWKANGGNGTIQFNLATMSLIIRNSAEWHYSDTNPLIKTPSGEK
jgi:hypothetical protein